MKTVLDFLISEMDAESLEFPFETRSLFGSLDFQIKMSVSQKSGKLRKFGLIEEGIFHSFILS